MVIITMRQTFYIHLTKSLRTNIWLTTTCPNFQQEKIKKERSFFALTEIQTVVDTDNLLQIFLKLKKIFNEEAVLCWAMR